VFQKTSLAMFAHEFTGLTGDRYADEILAWPEQGDILMHSSGDGFIDSFQINSPAP